LKQLLLQVDDKAARRIHAANEGVISSARLPGRRVRALAGRAAGRIIGHQDR
jgi:hypothetical protein